MKTPAEKCAERIAKDLNLEYQGKAFPVENSIDVKSIITAIIQSEYAGPIQVAREAIKDALDDLSKLGAEDWRAQKEIEKQLRTAQDQLKQL